MLVSVQGGVSFTDLVKEMDRAKKKRAATPQACNGVVQEKQGASDAGVLYALYCSVNRTDN